MRRALLICLMLTLPVQWGRAAAAAICKHETSGPSHFGHHPHEHEQGHDAQGAAAQPDGSDNDCATCHGPGVPALLELPALVLPALNTAPPAAALPRWVQRAPDNPLRPPLTSLA